MALKDSSKLREHLTPLRSGGHGSVYTGYWKRTPAAFKLVSRQQEAGDLEYRAVRSSSTLERNYAQGTLCRRILRLLNTLHLARELAETRVQHDDYVFHFELAVSFSILMLHSVFAGYAAGTFDERLATHSRSIRLLFNQNLPRVCDRPGTVRFTRGFRSCFSCLVSLLHVAV